MRNRIRLGVWGDAPNSSSGLFCVIDSAPGFGLHVQEDFPPPFCLFSCLFDFRCSYSPSQWVSVPPKTHTGRACTAAEVRSVLPTHHSKLQQRRATKYINEFISKSVYLVVVGTLLLSLGGGL